MGGAVADRGHPGLIGWSRLDPVDGGIGLDARAITPCARVGSSYLFDIAILNNDQRRDVIGIRACKVDRAWANRSEEHTSELQSLMRISYAVFCLKKKQNKTHNPQRTHAPNTDKSPLTRISENLQIIK